MPVEELDFDDSRASLFIITEKKAECVNTDAVWWLGVIMGIRTGFFLMVLILELSQKLEHKMEEVVSGDLRREKTQNSQLGRQGSERSREVQWGRQRVGFKQGWGFVL